MNSIKESDIRPKQMVRKMNKLRNEDLKLFKINQFLNVVCPACKSKKFNFLFKKSKFKFVECTKCQTVYVNPRPSVKLLDQFYSSSKCMNYWSEIYQKTEKTRINKKKYTFWVTSLPGGPISGYGRQLKSHRQENWKPLDFVFGKSTK